MMRLAMTAFFLGCTLIASNAFAACVVEKGLLVCDHASPAQEPQPAYPVKPVYPAQDPYAPQAPAVDPIPVVPNPNAPAVPPPPGARYPGPHGPGVD